MARRSDADTAAVNAFVLASAREGRDAPVTDADQAVTYAGAPRAQSSRTATAAMSPPPGGDHSARAFALRRHADDILRAPSRWHTRCVALGVQRGPMLRAHRFAAAAAALAATSACTHTVPLSFAPDGSVIVGDSPHGIAMAAPPPEALPAAETTAPPRGEVVVGPDWDLVITRRGGRRQVIEEPLRVARDDLGLRVTDRWGPRHLPLPDITSVALERPDTAGTVAVVTGCTLLVGLGMWGFISLAGFMASPDP